MHETYIYTHDYQCWHVIENDEYEIPEKKPNDKWDEPEFKKLEKNAKAKQLILNGLSICDVDKVMHLKTAKAMWEAIKVIHAGSTDQQNIVKHDLLKQFHNLSMTSSEDVSSYHSRF